MDGMKYNLASVQVFCGIVCCELCVYKLLNPQAGDFRYAVDVPWEDLKTPYHPCMGYLPIYFYININQM